MLCEAWAQPKSAQHHALISGRQAVYGRGKGGGNRLANPCEASLSPIKPQRPPYNLKRPTS